MKNVTTTAIVAVLALAGTGCSTLTPVGVDPFPMEWTARASGLEFCHTKEPSHCLKTSNVTTPAQRNDLQHRLLGVATDLCSEFRERLYSQTLSPLYLRTFGNLANVASISLIPHKATADAVGMGGEVAGNVAADMDGYFRETKMNIALAGIELARTRVFKQIIGSAADDLVNYPVGRAINDALRYHGVCNLADGLSESAGAVEAATNE